jgi:hypothetical protein
MRKFVPYQIIYTYIFYLENLMQENAAVGWNQYKSIWKIIEKIKIRIVQRPRPPISLPVPLLHHAQVASPRVPTRACSLEPHPTFLIYKRPPMWPFLLLLPHCCTELPPPLFLLHARSSVSHPSSPPSYLAPPPWALTAPVTYVIEPPQNWGVCLPRSSWGILDEARMHKHTLISIQYHI